MSAPRRTMNWRAVVITAALCVPLIALLATGFGRDPRATPSVLEGKTAPAFALKTLKGEPMTLETLRGRPVLINFWSTWCEPCKAEHALLQEAAEYHGADMQFVGVVYQDTRENAQKYLAERGQAYAQLYDEHGRMGVDYGVTGVPESFLVDAQGRLVDKHVGVFTAASLREAVARLGVRVP